MSLHPSGWDFIVGQLQKRTAWAGEAAAIAELSMTTGSRPAGRRGRQRRGHLAALFEAAALVFTNTEELPTWIAYGPMRVGHAWLTGRRWPVVRCSRSSGPPTPWARSSLGDFNLGPLGLQQIVTPAITTTDIFVGNSNALEAYVYPFPILEAVEPALLGRQVAVAEAMRFYRPTTSEAGPGNVPPAAGDGAVRVGP